MKVTAVILSHYKERQDNLKVIVDDLLSGTVTPNRIVVIIDNDQIEFEDGRVTIIRSSKQLLPKVRFDFAGHFDSDYYFFIDDDLSVEERTIENFVNYAGMPKYMVSVLGYEGSRLGTTNTPYADDSPVSRGVEEVTEVDIVIRTYFLPREVVGVCSEMMCENSDLPKEFLDDVYLCLGNKYLNMGTNYVVPVANHANLKEIGEHGVGQSTSGKHYENRNIVCRELMNRYE